jgi:hypothetical protein
MATSCLPYNPFPTTDDASGEQQPADLIARRQVRARVKRRTVHGGCPFVPRAAPWLAAAPFEESASLRVLPDVSNAMFRAGLALSFRRLLTRATE